MNLNNSSHYAVILVDGNEVFGKVEAIGDGVVRVHDPLKVIIKIVTNAGDEGKVLERYNPSSRQNYVDFKSMHIISISELSNLMVDYYQASLKYCDTTLDRVNDSNVKSILEVLNKVTKAEPDKEAPRIIKRSDVADGNDTKH